MRRVYTSGGHLVIVTCNEFPLGKWGEVSEATNRDHDQINYLLSHQLIGKFLPENVHLLKNPSTNEFKDTMSHLRKEVESSGFVVIILTTHVVKVVKGEKEHPKEVSYFAFHNSVWGTPVEIAESCISLSAFCGLMNKIPCAQKTLILNYAHVAKPRMALFPSSKILYPPQDFLSKLCEQAKCAVIACCAIGTPAKEYLRHSAYHINELTPTQPPATGGADRVRSLRDRVFGAFHHSDKELYDLMLRELMNEWGIKPFPEITKSQRPVKPVATWERKDDDIAIILPNQKERNNYTRRLVYWKVKRSLAKPTNFTLERYRAHLRHTFSAPCQTSIVDPHEPEYSVFGRALVNALRGGACKPHSKHVTALDVYTNIRAYMAKTNERLNALAQAEYRPENEQPSPVPVYQTPVLFVPQGHLEMANNPVCFKCDPPAAPEKPYIIRIGDNEVMLEWYNPTFDGIPPSKYKLAMKNKTRNFNVWADVYYPGDIVKTRFLVRNLPMGIACQFKVAGYNNGGWGEYSEPTTHVVPGEHHEVLPDALRWRRLRQGGLLAVLDQLEAHWYYHAEYTVGLRQLMGIGQNGFGFKNTKLTLRVAAVALKALHTYPLDEEIATYCFTLLGIGLRGVKFERKVRQLCLENDIVQLVERNMKYFRRNTRVMGGISFLRGGMAKYLPPEIEQDLSTLIPPPPSEETEEFEEEEEAVLEEDEEGDEEATQS